MTPQDVQKALMLANAEEKAELQALLDELNLRENRQKCRSNFLEFVRYTWPNFIQGEHHKQIASLFNEIAFGDKKRLIISLAPRHSKSEFASYLLPAWYLGLYPDQKVIQVSNTAELAEGFGSRVRNLLATEDYKNIFNDIELRADSKARGRWDTNKGGTYFAAGVGAALAGRGADLAILDDLHTEAEALAAVHNPGIYDKVYDWYTTGIRQRMQPGGRIVIVMTRWSKRDIIGQILENMGKPGADQWSYMEFPALLPSGKPLWEEYWSYEELNAIRAELPPGKWQAQYQQQPSSDETAIVKRDWWQRWVKEEPPPCDYTIMSLDCAFEAKESADFSAMTYWGVFTNAETNEQNIILLDAERKKLEFPELKQWAFDLYKEHKPDTIIVEKKASGAPLIFEFRRMGVPVQEYTPTRKANGVSNDKIARLNAVADIFSSGMVWAPYKRWAEDVIEELANFPAGRYDDYVDTCFSGETLITMRDGCQKHIAKVKKGEFVLTPYGPKRVLVSGCTGYSSVYRWRNMLVTGAHPIFTLRGWIPLLKLQRDDTILVLSTRRAVWPQEQIESLLDLMGISIKNTAIERILNVLVGSIYCIETFGSFLMVLYRMAAIFTTLTAIRVITTLKTWKCSKQRTTENCINQNCQPEVKQKNIWRIWSLLDLSLPNGISQKKAERGTENTQRAPLDEKVFRPRGVKWKRLKKYVKYVVNLLPLKIRPNKLFAPHDAHQQSATQSLKQKEENLLKKILENVKVVKNHLLLSAQHNYFVRTSAELHTTTPELSGKKLVYNLEIDEVSMYYANGVLVHNCTQALSRIRKGNMVSTRLDQQETWEDRMLFKARKARYY